MSQAALKKRYRTTNWKQYNSSLRARGSLTIWLDKKMSWFTADSGKRGRSAQFSDAAIAVCRHFGRKLWQSWSGYCRYSLVETKTHCIKRLGERVMSRTFERQANELHARIAILNRFAELGCPQTVAVA